MTKLLNWVPSLLLGTVSGLLASGCLGPELLEDRTEHAPAPNPRVELRLKTEEPADVLVLYDDVETKSGRVKRKGFYLFANETRLNKGKRPVFVEPDRIGSTLPIPILKEPPKDPKSIPGELYSLSSSPWVFTLQSHGRIVTEFELPKYGDWLTAKKFFLMPLAMAADAIGVGVAAGAAGAVMAGEEYIKSGGQIPAH